MTLRAYLLLFGVLLLAMASWTAANSAGGKAPAEQDKPGSSPQQPLYVSMIQLIATPDAFDGKFVRIKGFVRIEHEGSSIYLHREDAEHGLYKNGLWLAVSDSATPGSKEAEVKDRYALIEGQVNAKMTGHKGLWSGSVEKVTRMIAWEQKAKK